MEFFVFIQFAMVIECSTAKFAIERWPDFVRSMFRHMSLQFSKIEIKPYGHFYLKFAYA